MKDAKREINTQKLAAMAEVKNQVGGLAIEVSQKILKKELHNQPEQETYIDDLLKGIKLN